METIGKFDWVPLPMMPKNSVRVALERGIEHHQAGRLTEAEELYRAILASEPRCADALHLCGVIAIQTGRNESAVELIRQAVSLAPRQADYLANLGEALRQLGRFDEAADSLRRAIKLQPDFPVALNCLGVVEAARGRSREAEEYYRRALRFDPNYADAQHNLGNIHFARRQFPEAEACFRRVLASKPDFADAHAGLGNVWLAQHRLGEAIVSYRRALELNPGSAEAHSNLGSALDENNQPEEALSSIARALALKPEFAAAHYNLANVQARLGRLDEAIHSFQQAIALQPRYAEAYDNLGSTLKDRGEIEAAIASCRQALELQPGNAHTHSNIILMLLHQHGNDPAVIEKELRQWNQRYVKAVALGDFAGHNREPNRRLRVGYISNDLRQHSVAFFLLPLLEAHERDQYEIFGYTSNRCSDAVTGRIKGAIEMWRGLPDATDEDMARQIRADGIDLLVDLSGHTAGNHLSVFAGKPAPIQISYLGFPASTGLAAIDYRLTDPWADPLPATASQRTDPLVRLPETAWCFTPLSGSPPVGVLPALARGHVTFGCFNNFSKITEETLEVWARLLQRVPGSRLALKNLAIANRSVAQRLRGFFGRFGIDAARLELIPRTVSPLEHLQCHNQVDLALDTFPYHGTTTTCEALWMGVPVVTRAGVTHVARVGVSLLTNVGLLECVTRSPDEYVETAVSLVSDLGRLAGWRASLRERMQRSPLTDAPRFARNVENAYRAMWRNWTAAK